MCIRDSSYIFQASSTPAATAAAREALHIIKSEPERIQRLWDITNYCLLYTSIKQHGSLHCVTMQYPVGVLK